MRAPKGSDPPKLVAVTPDLAAAKRSKFLSSGPTPLPQATFHPQPPTSSFQSPEAPTAPRARRSSLEDALFRPHSDSHPDCFCGLHSASRVCRLPAHHSAPPHSRAQHPLRLAAHPSSASPQLRARTLPQARSPAEPSFPSLSVRTSLTRNPLATANVSHGVWPPGE